MPRGLADRFGPYRRMHDLADHHFERGMLALEHARARGELAHTSALWADLGAGVALGFFHNTLTVYRAVPLGADAASYQPRRPRPLDMHRFNRLMLDTRHVLSQYLAAGRRPELDRTAPFATVKATVISRKPAADTPAAQLRAPEPETSLEQEKLEDICRISWPLFHAGDRFSTHLEACVRTAREGLGLPGSGDALNFTGDKDRQLPAITAGDVDQALEFISSLRLGDGNPPAGAGAFILAQSAAHAALGRTYEPPEHMRRWLPVRSG